MKLNVSSVSWKLSQPFKIARSAQTTVETVHVVLTDEQGRIGRGEAAGVDYAGETVASMSALLQAQKRLFESMSVVHPREIQSLMPSGGARNALDCALWDLRAKQTGIPAWQDLGLTAPTRMACAYTIGIDPLPVIAAKALERRHFPLLKLKVDANSPLDLIRTVRENAPEPQLIVDANASWDSAMLEALMPELIALRVSLLEQPLAPNKDAYLSGKTYPIPLGADESSVDRSSFEKIIDRYQYANIKLDKTGGLTEAMACAQLAQAKGLKLMVGNMCGSSLAMAPGALIATLCEFVDLDGPLLQNEDVANPIQYADGWMSFPTGALWG